MKKKSLVFLAVLITMLMFALSACLDTDEAAKVKFMIDGKVVTTVEAADGAKLPTIAPKVGYTLSKWYFDKAYTEEFSFKKVVEKGLKGDVLVYAKWNKKPSTEELAYTYVSSIDGYEVQKGTANTSGVVIIAEVYDDGKNGEKPIKSIGEWAFSDCSGLTSITIPSSVTSIGTSAFSSCGSLESITIPNSVTSIGYGAFYGCGRLTSITIPSSVTSIGSSAFSGCSSLTSISMSAEVAGVYGASNVRTVIITSGTSIGDSAFNGCSSLTSITIPSSVTSIGSYAFEGCNGLTSITIPNSVTSIGDSAFSGCSGLTSINYKGTMAQWKAITKGYGWNSITSEYTVYCTDGNISK